jgi:hypothetical protein
MPHHGSYLQLPLNSAPAEVMYIDLNSCLAALTLMRHLLGVSHRAGRGVNPTLGLLFPRKK